MAQKKSKHKLTPKKETCIAYTTKFFRRQLAPEIRNTVLFSNNY